MLRILLLIMLSVLSISPLQAGAPIVIALNVDLSSKDAEAGEAIRRGALVAIRELNRAGGVLGRPLMLEIHDHRRNPARGVENVRQIAKNAQVIAILGGKHTPVIHAQLELIHSYGIPYLIPWAAGTHLVEHHRRPNFVFRVSIRDEFAGQFLIDHALAQGYKRLALVLEQTSWGRSNELSLTLALRDHGLAPAWVEWFNWGEQRFQHTLQRIQQADVDAVIFVGNAPDAANFMLALQDQPPPQRLPVISHWGLIGGEFEQRLAGQLGELDLCFVQTFSFFNPPFPARAEQFLEGYRALFPQTRSIADIYAPSAVAHSYDLVHLLASAITQAGVVERSAVQRALEQLKPHAGLVRDYHPPFAPERHDALDISDLQMGRFSREGGIIPLSVKE